MLSFVGKKNDVVWISAALECITMVSGQDTKVLIDGGMVNSISSANKVALVFVEL